jgi:hypothetical protein
MKLIPEWEQSCNQPFLVHGSRFVEDLAARLDRDQGGKAIGKVSLLSSSPLALRAL